MKLHRRSPPPPHFLPQLFIPRHHRSTLCTHSPSACLSKYLDLISVVFLYKRLCGHQLQAPLERTHPWPPVLRELHKDGVLLPGRDAQARGDVRGGRRRVVECKEGRVSGGALTHTFSAGKTANAISIFFFSIVCSSPPLPAERDTPPPPPRTFFVPLVFHVSSPLPPPARPPSFPLLDYSTGKSIPTAKHA